MTRQLVDKMKNESISICPDGLKCLDYNTCCKNPLNQYYCVNAENATCCSRWSYCPKDFACYDVDKDGIDDSCVKNNQFCPIANSQRHCLANYSNISSAFDIKYEDLKTCYNLNTVGDVSTYVIIRLQQNIDACLKVRLFTL
uniref:Uncharacterized protein n=1 Tax=Acrobeloides nanus TaxID=290746 RepID=A0A914DYQ8_9BILA